MKTTTSAEPEDDMPKPKLDAPKVAPAWDISSGDKHQLIKLFGVMQRQLELVSDTKELVGEGGPETEEEALNHINKNFSAFLGLLCAAEMAKVNMAGEVLAAIKQFSTT